MPPRRTKTSAGRVALAVPGTASEIPTQIIISSQAKGGLGDRLARVRPELTPKEITEFNRLVPNEKLTVDLLQMLAEMDTSEGLAFLQNHAELSSTEIIFASPKLESVRRKELLDVEILRAKPKGSASTMACRRCGSKETVVMEKQTRSADEPMTIIVTCLACGSRTRT